MISARKIEVIKKDVIKKCSKCDGKGCGICYRYCSFIDKMAEAEIPVDYFFREMKDFYGDPNFKKAIMEYHKNIDDEYLNGVVHCFVGHRGTGKTLAACTILKCAIVNNYSVYYTNMVDIANKLMSNEGASTRKMLKQTDFLVLDEVDQRFFPTVNSQDLYGNHFENIIRTRTQNRLPMIMCTNSEDINQIFGGQFQESFNSIQSQFIKVLPVAGKDARTDKEKM